MFFSSSFLRHGVTSFSNRFTFVDGCMIGDKNAYPLIPIVFSCSPSFRHKGHLCVRCLVYLRWHIDMGQTSELCGFSFTFGSCWTRPCRYVVSSHFRLPRSRPFLVVFRSLFRERVATTYLDFYRAKLTVDQVCTACVAKGTKITKFRIK